MVYSCNFPDPESCWIWIHCCVYIITSCWHWGHVTSELFFHLKCLPRSIRRSSPLTLMRWPGFGDVSCDFILHVLTIFAVKGIYFNFSSDIFFTLINTETSVMPPILSTWNLTWEQLSSPKLKPSWLGHMTWLDPRSLTDPTPDVLTLIRPDDCATSLSARFRGCL